ncbi:ATP-dependent Zn protease [Paraburkholderia youngii]
MRRRHGLVAALPGTGVLEQVTIMPRGCALGVALITKAQDKHLYRETEIRNEVEVLLGGRNAEILMFAEASSGAASDLQEASRIGLDMVSKFEWRSCTSPFRINKHLGVHEPTRFIHVQPNESVTRDAIA